MKPKMRVIIGLVLLAAASAPVFARQPLPQLPPGSARVGEAIARPVPIDAAQRITLDPFTPEQAALAEKLAHAEVAGLKQRYPELQGLEMVRMLPFYQEHNPLPLGVSVDMRLPGSIDIDRIDLVRSGVEGGRNIPEAIPSAVRNLKALNSIIELSTGSVIIRGIIPLIDEAWDPENIAKVRTLDPEKFKNPAYADAGGD